MKKVLALLISSAMLLCFLAACSSNETPPAVDPDPDTDDPTISEPLDVIKIGVYEPSTGENGAGGKQEILGMQYANELTPEVEIDGVTYKVELVYADNASSPDKAPSAAQLLVSEKVSVILGSYGSTVSIAGAQIFADAGIPAIGVTCTNPQVTQGNDYYFRICFIDPFQGAVQANFAMDNFDAKTAYVLAELGNDYDMGLANYFTQAFEAAGGKVTNATFTSGTADFSAYLNSAKGSDVIFSPCSISYATQIVNQAHALGIDMPIMAGDTWDSNMVVDAAQGTGLEIYVSTFYHEGANPEFDENFRTFINSSPAHLSNNGGNDMISAVSVMGYDAYNVALETMKIAGSSDSADILNALWDVDYMGVSGKIVFGENGDADRDTAYIKAVDTENATWVLITEQRVD